MLQRCVYRQAHHAAARRLHAQAVGARVRGVSSSSHSILFLKKSAALRTGSDTTGFVCVHVTVLTFTEIVLPALCNSKQVCEALSPFPNAHRKRSQVCQHFSNF